MPEIKFVTVLMKRISSKYSPTNGIWALLLRGQSTVAMDNFLWNFSFYQDMLPYIHIVCKPHSHIPYRSLKIDNFLGTGLFRIIPPPPPLNRWIVDEVWVLAGHRTPAQKPCINDSHLIPQCPDNTIKP